MAASPRTSASRGGKPSSGKAAVLVLAVVYLVAAVAILEYRQFPPSEEI